MSDTSERKEKLIEEIFQRYQNSLALQVSEACQDCGQEPLFGRLERAAMNQAAGGDTAVFRYAIWANTLRDTVIACIRELGADAENREVIKKLVRVANALSAFSDIQVLLDPVQMSSDSLEQ